MEAEETLGLALARTQAYILEHYGSDVNEPWCYHTQFSYHLQIKQLALPLFFKAVNGVLHRHPVIRTGFVTNALGEVRQVVQPTLKLPIRFDDISALPAAAQTDWLEQLLLQDRNQPFAYGHGKALSRAYITKRSPESLQLVLVFHHAIWDGWSLAVLLREIFAYYVQLTQEPTAALLPGAYEYQAFVEAEAARSSSVTLNVWRQHLARHEFYAPQQRAVSAAYNNYAPLEVRLSADLMARLSQVQQRLRVTLKAVFLGLLVRLVQDEVQQEHTTIGVVTNGRSMDLLNPLTTLGLLWHFAPLCVAHAPDLATQLRLVNQTLAEVAAFGVCPIDELLREKQVPSLFHAAFNFINFEGANLLPPNSGIDFLEVGGLDKFHCPLHLLVGKNPFTKTMSLVLNYDTRCYHRAQAEAMLTTYVRRLENLTETSSLQANPFVPYHLL